MSSSAITRWVRWLGLAVVLAAAAVLSFHGLQDLALAVSLPDGLAPLLPVAVDAGAGVSCACWLSRDIPPDAARFARAQTWLLLGGTVIGNAAQLGMHAAGIVPPWWVAVLVGAIPPAVVGGTIHLAVLVGRPTLPPAPAELEGPGEDREGLTARLLADGVGRAELARQLDITEWDARKLLEAHRRRLEAQA